MKMHLIKGSLADSLEDFQQDVIDTLEDLCK